MATTGTTTLESLGVFIRERRRILELTQTQLAERLGWVQERISTLERGKYGMPSLPALARLATALEAPLSEILQAAGYSDLTPTSGSPEDSGRPSSSALLYTLQRLLAIDALGLGEALNQASDLLISSMGSDKIDIFMYDAASESLVAVGTSDSPMGRLQHELGLHREPIANGGVEVGVYETGESYITGSADADPHMLPGISHELGVRSMVAVALTVDGQRRGVLVAESAERDRYSEDDLRFMEAVSGWVSTIVHRAELAEQNLAAAEREARRVAEEESIARLAHDIGSRLTPLSGRIEVSRRRATEEMRERDMADLEVAMRSVERMQMLVAQLIDASKLDQGTFFLAKRPVNLVQIVQEVARLFENGDVNVQIRVPDKMIVYGDPERLRHTLEIILTTVFVYAAEGLRATIELEYEQQKAGQRAVLSVHDEGSGLPLPLNLPLSKPLVTGADPDGFEFGLYLARRIVEAHGGSLALETIPGKGSKFRMTIPTGAS